MILAPAKLTTGYANRLFLLSKHITRLNITRPGTIVLLASTVILAWYRVTWGSLNWGVDQIEIAMSVRECLDWQVIKGSQPPLGCTTPRQMGLDYVWKGAEKGPVSEPEKKPASSTPLWSCLHLPNLGFCLDFPLLWTVTWKCNPNIHFPLQVVFGQETTDKQARTVMQSCYVP